MRAGAQALLGVCLAACAAWGAAYAQPEGPHPATGMTHRLQSPSKAGVDKPGIDGTIWSNPQEERARRAKATGDARAAAQRTIAEALGSSAPVPGWPTTRAADVPDGTRDGRVQEAFEQVLRKEGRLPFLTDPVQKQRALEAYKEALIKEGRLPSLTDPVQKHPATTPWTAQVREAVRQQSKADTQLKDILASRPDVREYKIDPKVLSNVWPAPPRPPLPVPDAPPSKRPCPQCIEVDPVNAGLTLAALDLSVGGMVAAGRVDTQAAESLSSCSAAVRKMRETDESGYTRIDSKGFNHQCLGNGQDRIAAAMEMSAVETCFKLYARFDKTCLKTSTGSRDEALLQEAGVLVRTIPGLPLAILCSAWRVGADSVLSARHCLAKELLAPGRRQVGARPLAFIPYAEATSLPFDPTSGRVGLTVTAEIGKDGSRTPLSFPETEIRIEDDIVLLALEVDAGAHAGARARPAVRIPAQVRKGQTLTVIGFQEFVYRAFMLGTRLNKSAPPSDELLVASGEWRKFMRVHRSPVCIGMPTDRASLSHFCQTFGRTSGAPVFVLGSVDDAVVYLVGVHSRGSEEGEDSFPTNEAIALKRGVHPYLDKVLGADTE